MALNLTTAPTVEPVTTAEAKTHLRVDDSNSDTYIATLVKAARQYIEGVTNRALVSQTWTFEMDEFPIDGIRLPRNPVKSVTSVKYYDADGVQQTLTVGDDYTVDSKSDPAWIMPGYGVDWPTTYDVVNAVEVVFVAGYADSGASPVDLADNVPQPLKQAVLLLVGDWFDTREDMTPGSVGNISHGVKALIAPYRNWTF